VELPDEEVQLLRLIRDYKQHLLDDPASNSFLPLAHCYNKLGLVEAAVDVVKRGLEKNPDHVLALLLLADLLAGLEDFDEASVLYERVLSLDEQSVDALIGLARLDLHQNNFERANDRIVQLATKQPHHQAIDELRSQIAQNNSASDEGVLLPTATMAELYLKQGLKEKAVSIYRQLLHHQPNEVKYRDRLASLLDQPINVNVSLDKDNHVEGLEKWLIAIERRRKNV